ncbi:MAG TPA: dihydropteroate synthase, partial [Candidatus Saccharimonadales bacterium]|nr:dihydropteroate synthase [Candidatus Saccharimonadales bacterium]
MTHTAGTLSLIFQLNIPGRASLVPLEAAELRSSLGLRPMALAELSREADRPCYALLSDSDDLLSRVWQLAGRCGLKGSTGAISPMPLEAAGPGGENGRASGGRLVNGVILTGPESGFEKMYEVMAVSGDRDEGRLARAGERALAAAGPQEILLADGRGLRPGSLAEGGRPLVMGILNVTPDSFSDGGRFSDPQSALARARTMIEEGADILDIGGESSRPGSEPVAMEEESRRVLPVIEALARESAVPLSIDTTKAEVARRAVAAGASIINDISGLTMDPLMPALAATLKVPVVLNHIRGVPRTMQESPSFQHVVLEVLLDLAARVRLAEEAGVEP